MFRGHGSNSLIINRFRLLGWAGLDSRILRAWGGKRCIIFTVVVGNFFLLMNIMTAGAEFYSSTLDDLYGKYYHFVLVKEYLVTPGSYSIDHVIGVSRLAVNHRFLRSTTSNPRSLLNSTFQLEPNMSIDKNHVGFWGCGRNFYTWPG